MDISRIIVIGIVIGIVIVSSMIGLYYVTSQNDSYTFLKIIDYEIIQTQGYPLLLSVITSENIPEKKDDSVEGYGFGWFSKSDVLTGYTLNVHSGSDKWHNESITIQDKENFCFDNAEIIIGNAKIKQNKLSVIIEMNDIENFDRVISFVILKDKNCHLGFAGKVIDTKMIN